MEAEEKMFLKVEVINNCYILRREKKKVQAEKFHQVW